MIADHQDSEDHQPAVTEDFAEDKIMDTLLQEGDEDATRVADFEGTATDVVQSDPELASALTAYTEARRRLSEKFRSRGFWPPSNFGKGKSKAGHHGPKGKFGKSGLELNENLCSSGLWSHDAGSVISMDTGKHSALNVEVQLLEVIANLKFRRPSCNPVRTPIHQVCHH